MTEVRARFRSRAIGVVVALLAVGFITAMAVTGGRRESQQRVRFEAAGLMAATPSDVDRVEVTGEGRQVTLLRAGGRWNVEGRVGRAPDPLASSLETSLRFMHAAEPVRTLARGEWQGTALEEFGLAPARYVVRLSGRGRTVLATRFGVTNPQQVLQYAQVDGRDEVYLLPRFVGKEWERVLEGAAAR